MRKFTVDAENIFVIKGRGVGYSMPSPVTCERNRASFIDAWGSEFMTINGIEYRIRAVEMFLPGTPLAIDEPISVMV
jgi:hypothetical protein